MSMITYNGLEVLSGQVTPLISKTTSYNSQGDTRTLHQNNITLRGEITGCGIDELSSGRQLLIDTFSESFRNLYVSGVDTFTGVKIDSITFDETPYLQILPYSVSMTHYPSGGFLVAHGVEAPQNTWTYQEQEDQTVIINQSVSAKGVNTDFDQSGLVSGSVGNALQNAINFVSGQMTGAWEIPRPYIIDTSNTNFKCYLTSFSEDIDKLSNTVSVSRSFRTDPTDLEGNVIIRYTKQFDQDIGSPIRISCNGTVDAGKTGCLINYPSTRSTGNLEQARNRYEEFKNSLLGEVGSTDFLTESVTEDTGINRISFQLSFNSGDTEPSIIDDFTITVQESSDSSLVSVSMNGTVRAKKGCVGTNFAAVDAYYNSGNHKFQICDQIYREFYTTEHGSAQNRPNDVVLNVKPLSDGVSKNENLETVSYNRSLDDRNLLAWANDSTVNSVDYNMVLTPSLQVVKSTPSNTNSGFIFEDLGYSKRAKFSINTSSSSDISKDSYVNFANSQFRKMTNSPDGIILERDTYELSNSNASSSNYEKSFYSQYQILDIGSSYTGLDDFRL